MKGGRYLEDRHVRKVYDTIAPTFNDIPQKVWPNVKKFIKGLDPGAIVADIGCGNGRYLHINKTLYKIGVDACLPLIELSREKGYEVLAADNLSLPFRDSAFDAVLSIGVLHHFSTKERRIKALRELCRILRPGGKLLLYVWAYEQKHRKFDGQDVLVPWHAGKRTRPKGIYSSDHDMSSTSSLSEDDSIDLPSCDNLIQRTVSDPECPCYHQPQTSMLNKLLTSTMKPLTSRQRSNTLPSSFEALTGYENDNGQIEEECRKLQVTLREMAANHDQLSGSNDSVFGSNDKLDNGQDGILFETQPKETMNEDIDVKNKPIISETTFGVPLFEDDITAVQVSTVEVPPVGATCDMNCNPKVFEDEMKDGKHHKGDKKTSLFDTLKKRFLKFIDSKFDNEMSAKCKVPNQMCNPFKSLSHNENDENNLLSNLDGPFQSFAVREFPMSSYPDYLKTENKNSEYLLSSYSLGKQILQPGQESVDTENMSKNQQHSGNIPVTPETHSKTCDHHESDKTKHQSICKHKLMKKLSRSKKICDDDVIINGCDHCSTESFVNGAHNSCDTQKCNRNTILNDYADSIECNKFTIGEMKSVKKGSLVSLKINGNGFKYVGKNSSGHQSNGDTNFNLEFSGKFVRGHQGDVNKSEGDNSCFKPQVSSFCRNELQQLNSENGCRTKLIVEETDNKNVSIKGHQGTQPFVAHQHIDHGNCSSQICEKLNQNHIMRNGCSERLSSSHNDLSSCNPRSIKSGADSVPSIPSSVTQEAFQMSSTRLCRFYHVFKQGELSNLVVNHIDNLSVVSCTYDHGNWCLVSFKT